MLAGPITNPICFSSTLVAYRFDWRIPLLRALIGYTIAVMVALLIGRLLRGRLTRKDLDRSISCDVRDARFENKPVRVLRTAAEDLFVAGRYLVMGAFVAGLMQASVGRETLLALGSAPVPAILLMMALAFVLSVCADGDAFVAASFGKAFFPLSSQMAFMVLGPMLDIKLFLMYRMVFPRRTVLALVALVPLLVLSASLVLETLPLELS